MEPTQQIATALDQLTQAQVYNALTKAQHQLLLK